MLLSIIIIRYYCFLLPLILVFGNYCLQVSNIEVVLFLLGGANPFPRKVVDEMQEAVGDMISDAARG